MDEVFSVQAADVQAAEGMTRTLREIAGGAENPAKMAYVTLSFLGMIDPEELSDIAERLWENPEPEILEAAERAEDVQELRVLAESLVAEDAPLQRCPFCKADTVGNQGPNIVAFACGSQRVRALGWRDRWEIGGSCIQIGDNAVSDPTREDFADADRMQNAEEWAFLRQLPEFLDEMAAGAQRIREAQRAFREGESWVGPICDATALMVEFCRIVLPKWQGLDKFVRDRIDQVPEERGQAEWAVKGSRGHVCGFCGFPLPGNGAVAPPPSADQGAAIEPDLGKLASLVGSLEGLYRDYVGAKFSGKTSIQAESGNELLEAVVGEWFEIRAALLDAGDGGPAEGLAMLSELLDIEERQGLADRLRAHVQILLEQKRDLNVRVQRGLPSGRAYIVANDLRSGLVSSGMVLEHDDDGQFSVELAILCHVGQLLRWRRQGHKPIRRA